MDLCHHVFRSGNIILMLSYVLGSTLPFILISYEFSNSGPLCTESSYSSRSSLSTSIMLHFFHLSLLYFHRLLHFGQELLLLYSHPAASNNFFSSHLVVSPPSIVCLVLIVLCLLRGKLGVSHELFVRDLRRVPALEWRGYFTRCSTRQCTEKTADSNFYIAKPLIGNNALSFHFVYLETTYLLLTDPAIAWMSDSKSHWMHSVCSKRSLRHSDRLWKPKTKINQSCRVVQLSTQTILLSSGVTIVSTSFVFEPYHDSGYLFFMKTVI